MTYHSFVTCHWDPQIWKEYLSTSLPVPPGPRGYKTGAALFRAHFAAFLSSHCFGDQRIVLKLEIWQCSVTVLSSGDDRFNPCSCSDLLRAFFGLFSVFLSSWCLICCLISGSDVIGTMRRVCLGMDFNLESSSFDFLGWFLLLFSILFTNKFSDGYLI